MLVGTKLQHVVSSLALEILEQTGPAIGNQIKPRDDLFWFGKPEILLRLIQFIIFQVQHTSDCHIVRSLLVLDKMIDVVSPFMSRTCRMHSRWRRLSGPW